MSDSDDVPWKAAQPKNLVLVPEHGKGKELCDMLRAELGLPKYVVEFEVRFARHEVISVRCKYNVAARDDPPSGEPTK